MPQANHPVVSKVKNMYPREEKNDEAFVADSQTKVEAAERVVIDSEQNSTRCFLLSLVYGVTFVIVKVVIGPRSRSCSLPRGCRSFALAAAVAGFVACRSFGPCSCRRPYRPCWDRIEGKSRSRFR
jgi:hypothetical protein